MVDKGAPRGVCTGEMKTLQVWEEPIHPPGSLSISALILQSKLTTQSFREHSPSIHFAVSETKFPSSLNLHFW